MAAFFVLPLTPALITELNTPLIPSPAYVYGLTVLPPDLSIFPAIPDACSLNTLANDLLKPPKAVPKTS